MGVLGNRSLVPGALDKSLLIGQFAPVCVCNLEVLGCVCVCKSRGLQDLQIIAWKTA